MFHYKTKESMAYDLNKRVIDMTLGELGAWMEEKMTRIVRSENYSRPAIMEGIHPDTGLPEGPLEYVSDVRACEILGTKQQPLSKNTLHKYKAVPIYDPAGRCTNGGKSLPSAKIGARSQYMVGDLLALKKNKHHFVKHGRNRSK